MKQDKSLKGIISFDSLYDQLRWELLQHRYIFLDEPFGEETAGGYCRALEYLAFVSSEPITISIISPGGDVFAAFALYDTIRKLQERGIEIIGEVRGYCASAAVIVLQACSKRVAFRYSRLLIHEVRNFSLFSEESATVASEKAQELNKLNDITAQIIASRSGHAIEEVKKLWKKTDVWMSVEEAKDFNLIDVII